MQSSGGELNDGADAEPQVWRRVPRDQWKSVDGLTRPSSGAFSDSSDGSGMSVHVQAVAEAHGLRPADLLPAPAAEFGMVGLPVVTLLEDAQTVLPDPLPTDPTHANVVGRKTRGCQRRWARQAAVLVPLPSP